MGVTEECKKKSEKYERMQADPREGCIKKHENPNHGKLKVCVFHQIINRLKQNFIFRMTKIATQNMNLTKIKKTMKNHPRTLLLTLYGAYSQSKESYKKQTPGRKRFSPQLVTESPYLANQHLLGADREMLLTIMKYLLLGFHLLAFIVVRRS